MTLRPADPSLALAWPLIEADIERIHRALPRASVHHVGNTTLARLRALQIGEGATVYAVRAPLYYMDLAQVGSSRSYRATPLGDNAWRVERVA